MKKQAQSGFSIWVLFGTLLFAGFVTLTMMDLLLLLCAMAGMIGILYLAKGERATRDYSGSAPGSAWACSPRAR